MAATYAYDFPTDQQDLYNSFSGSNYDGSGSDSGPAGSAGGSGSASGGLDVDFGFADPQLMYLAATQQYAATELSTKQYAAQPHYEQLAALSSRSSLSNASNASSPGYPYSVPGSSTTQSTSAFAKHSSPSPPLDRTVEIARMQPQPRQNYTPSNHASSSFQPGSHFRPSTVPLSQHPHQQQYASNQRPHTVSPPDSATPASADWHAHRQTPVQHQVDNETLVRMIAEAQAQGQTANPGNYYDSLQQHISKPLPQSQPTYATYSHQSMPIFQQQQQQQQPGQSYLPNNYPSQPIAYNPHEGEQEVKKRRVSAPITAARAVSKGAKAKPQQRKSISPQVVSPPQQRPMVLDTAMSTFAFSNSTNAAVESARSSSIYNSVDLIAGAGMHDTRRADVKVEKVTPAARIPIARAGTATDTKVYKPAAKEKAPKKPASEKRKKGEKGHNAVERRYRNNINNHIATLRDIVPALRHLKPLPSMPASRRRASQFTLSTASQAPTPAGLIDGIPAAKTLSKGTILGKSIEYITFLQGARRDAEEDLQILMGVTRDMLGDGGAALIEEYSRRRETREVDREKERVAVREEQAEMDRDDNSEVDEAEEDDDVEIISKEPARAEGASRTRSTPMKQSHSAGLAQARQQQFVAEVAPKFTPSPPASDELSVSPNLVQQQFLPQHGAPPRILFAAFMGISFAGGLGYDWTYNNFVSDSDVSTSTAWAGADILRAYKPTPSSGLVSSSIVPPGVLSGLVFLGLATIIASVGFLLLPLFTRLSFSSPTSDGAKQGMREQRRSDALNSLQSLNGSNSDANLVSSGSEKTSSLLARTELLKLVGAPTFAFLLPALLLDGLVAALGSVTAMRFGSFESASETERTEAAVAWIRIAEIEITVGRQAVPYLFRCYTFLRLYNLSHSPHWPQSTSSTALPTVNALLALQLSNLGQSHSAHQLWDAATNGSRKKTDTLLDPSTEIALSTNFDRVKAILAVEKSSKEVSERSDTLPLLRVSESRCEAALRETWAKIFVAVVQTTCSASGVVSKDGESFESIVDRELLVETVDHVLLSTDGGGTVNTLARITKALCSYYTGEMEEATSIALSLAEDVKRNGPITRLGCARAFFSLLLGDGNSITSGLSSIEPSREVDILASTTLGWLTIKRKSQISGRTRKVDPALHTTTLSIRRLLGANVFHDSALIEFCSSDEKRKFDLESAQDAVLEALEDISRIASGLRPMGEVDSGVELSD